MEEPDRRAPQALLGRHDDRRVERLDQLRGQRARRFGRLGGERLTRTRARMRARA
ncbi:MAG TPA: hypothetical protein VFX49_05905 [Chloroflexota bacterium]|nr:hypothetical protein [Chloroflexota bacterium]